MKTVHKKMLRPERNSDRVVVEMPRSAEVLLVAAQEEMHEWPTMWYSLLAEESRYDAERDSEWWVQIVPTGGEVPKNATHLGTAAMLYGNIIWHVYRLEKGEEA